MSSNRKPAETAKAKASPGGSASPASDSASESSKDTPADAAADLGLKERRRLVRQLPVPEAVESESDTDWAAFQELVEDPAQPETRRGRPAG